MALGETPGDLGEEPSVADIADACREVLGLETCDEIAAQEDYQAALGLAFTALDGVVEDPEAFLKDKNILE
ncbi:MAG: hypothetical protein AAB592_02800 [Patescibacteria group bacterium]